ncbi:MAG TPA: acyltransferase domain-containing protein [Pyrinomonadaceae bacterium]|nr:acyltransferase domain-containing protein [Pyrinomonadaceae bacterium]
MAALESLAPQRVFDSRQEPVERPLAFMFPGGGAQYFQMGLGLYREERVFREQFDSCAEILLPELGRDIRKVLYPDAAQIEAARAQFAEPPCIMATVFVVEYALARLLMSWGLQPEAMIGHSFGEYVAACLSGVFTLRDALRLIALRGQLFDKMDEGAMLSVPLPGDEVSDMFGEHLSIAAVNGPSRCVVSGRPEAVAALEAKLAGMKVSCSRMQANRAGHSEMVEPILKPFSGYLSTLRLQSPNIPFISNVTGTWITASEATSVDYWVRHLRQTVQFGQGIRELVKEPARILFEVGPGQTLSSLARRQLADKRTQLTLPSLRDQAAEISDVEFLLSALGKLWLAGVRPDWAGFHQTEKRQRLSLPTYHFERQRYWKEPKRQAAQTAARSSSPSAGDETTNLHVPVWKRSLASPATPRTRFEPPRQKYLIFTDECGLGERLAGRLKEENHSVISVRPGDGFRRLSDDLYTLNPRTAADYPKLFDDLRAEGSLPSQILHLWSVDRSVADSSRGDACEFFEETQRASSDSLWQIAQAIGGHHDTDAIQLLVISTGVQAVTGEEQLKPAKATLLGACTSIPLKFSNINCRSVDISLPREFGEAGESRLVGQLINEINCECRDTFVGYRGAYRWLQEYEELRADVLSSEKPELRAGGVYLAANGVEESSLWLVEHAAKIVGGKWVFVIPPDVELPHGFARLNDYGRDANVSREFPTAAARTKAAARIDLKIDGEIEHIARLEEAFDRDANVKTVESYTGLTEGLNRLCLSYLCEFLVRQYPAIGRGRTMSRAELESSVGVTPEFKHLWDVCVNVLSHDGVIRADERSVEFLKDPQEMADPEQLREALDQTYPDFSASFWLVQHCIRSYGKIFSGEITANNVLYPDGSYEMLNNLARQSVETTKSRVYRSLLAAVVTHIAQKSDRTLRILEVGAGTGILTWDVVAALKQLNVEYYFTDIGKAFVVRAQREATEKGLAGMRFGTLDISREPSAQGFEKYGFDMILGFDVVQATRNIEQTLTHLKDLLAPHGVLFLLQTLRVYRWQHLTFGLSPGWWNYRNDPLRGASPVLSLNEWEAVLKGQGFESVSSYPLKGEEKANAGFGMIVAQRPAEINHEEILERSPDGHRERDGLKQDIVSRLDALKVLGAEVYLAQADQTSVEQLKDVVAQVQARFNELNGVFYTAESYSETGKAEEPLPDAASPAIRSLYALRDALHDRHPNFCLLASSPAGFEATQANFAAASTNCFLEALVSERNMSDADGCWKSLRLNLEPAAGNPTVTPILAPSKIEEALKYVLGLRQVSHAVLRTEDGLGQGAQVSSDAHARGQQEQSVARTAGERASIQSSDTGADDHVAQALTAIWRDLLGVAYVGRHDNFFDLGGDSLIALQLISRLRDSLHVNVSVTELFDKQTIETLAEFIAQRLSAASPSAETAHGVLTMERGDGDIDQLLNRLEQLSDEEIQSLLREDKNV